MMVSFKKIYGSDHFAVHKVNQANEKKASFNSSRATLTLRPPYTVLITNPSSLNK